MNWKFTSVALIFLYLINFNVQAQDQSKTFLNCTSQLTVWDKASGESKYEEKFDVEIIEDKDGLSITTSPNSVGASISFGKRAYAHNGNIKNYSNESKLHYTYDKLQPDGAIFTSEEFNINRYTGSIFISSKSKYLSASSIGTCKAFIKKIF